LIVVSNTSPLNYLVLLKKDFVLPALFGTVIAPPAVAAELSREQAPQSVREWIAARPVWLKIQAPRSTDATLDLDIGEKEAIALALELNADRILLDESKARQAAKALGLRVAGTLAILFEAGERGLLDFKQTIHELRQTTFYLDDKLIQALLDRIDKRRA
jgi:predicted nucleic acid-binding protein